MKLELNDTSLLVLLAIGNSYSSGQNGNELLWLPVRFQAEGSSWWPSRGYTGNRAGSHPLVRLRSQAPSRTWWTHRVLPLSSFPIRRKGFCGCKGISLPLVMLRTPLLCQKKKKSRTKNGGRVWLFCAGSGTVKYWCSDLFWRCFWCAACARSRPRVFLIEV